MLARFIGGTWDGKLREMGEGFAGARLFMVPVPPSSIGSIDDLAVFDVAEIHDPSLRPPMQFQTQTYRRRIVRDADGQLSEVLYELESVK